MKSISYIVHDKTAARKATGDKLPLCQFTGGDQKVLLPNGQYVNRERYLNGPRKISGKPARRERIAQRRANRELAIAATTP